MQDPSGAERAAPLSVRAAEPADASEIARLHVRSWQVAYRGLLPDACLDGLRAEEPMGARWSASSRRHRQHRQRERGRGPLPARPALSRCGADASARAGRCRMGSWPGSRCGLTTHFCRLPPEARSCRSARSARPCRSDRSARSARPSRSARPGHSVQCYLPGRRPRCSRQERMGRFSASQSIRERPRLGPSCWSWPRA